LTEFDLEILGKLVIAAVLGLIIGLEREMKHKPVGLKTCLIISIVSCLLTVVSIESAYKAAGSEDVNISMDPCCSSVILSYCNASVKMSV